MKKLLVLLLFLTTTVVFSQGTITGTVIDTEMNAPLLGANVMVSGTTTGTSTDFDGNFSLEVEELSGEIVITYVGFTSKVVPYNISSGATVDLGEINLEPDGNALGEIVISTYSLAIDRKTPVAVSTITAKEIETKLGNQEFPEILKSTPGIYATRQGGGFGDARVNIRGFASENVAVLINGIPVNDMENGSVYWSNWAGLADVTRTMQVQRGLGASKVAVPSIGGTINVVTQSTDAEEGGNVFASKGNDGYTKYGATYSTGLMDNGFAASISLARTYGDGYVDGTEFSAISYFANISKRFNDQHELSLTAFGAKQRHGQRQNRHLISTYRASESGRRYNSDWGYRNGQVVHIEDNFYNKPQISLNHYWTISDKTSLTNIVYASFGSGGGGGTRGEAKFTNPDYRLGPLGPVDIDRIVDENIANGAGGSESILRASRNDHSWYGLLSTFKTELTDDIDLLAGLDLRDYTGSHFYVVTDLLGGTYFADDSDENNPNRTLQVGDKFNYYNDGKVGWQGLFGQLEYTRNELSAFLSLAASNTSYKRIDYFQYLADDPLRETDRYNFLGYSAKGGANYNLTDNHNVFANLGYFEKAPGFDAVFFNFNNEEINEDAENQKILSFELGYGFRSSKLSANLNLYRTAWKDRTETRQFQLSEEETAFANILGVNAIHQGIELDFVYRATERLNITGMFSLGDWRWEDDIDNVEIRNESQEIVQTVDLAIADVPVADAAQTTMALGLSYDLLEKTSIYLDYNYYDRLYADFDPSEGGYPSGEGLPSGPWELPSYGLFDATLSHSFKIGDFDAIVTGRLNNVFDTEYIPDALDGTNSDARTALVWYGVGRTFSAGLRINF